MRRTATVTRRRFALVEVVTALGLLGLMLAGIYASIRVNEQMLRHYVRQRQALDVLDNVVERLAAEAPVALPRCRALLADELAQSPLAGGPGLFSTCEPAPEGGIYCLIRNHDRRLADVRIGHREP